MFEHEFFDRYEFHDLPLDQDCYLIDECYMAQYEASILDISAGRHYDPVGYVAFASPRKIGEDWVELSWYADVNTRFHEVNILLQRRDFVACVGAWRVDEKPHIFVRSGWLDDLYQKSHVIYCLIDAIDMRNALRSGTVTEKKLLTLRAAVDELAARNPHMVFISFADNLLIKANWTTDYFLRRQENSYEPEGILGVIVGIRRVYREILGLDVYSTLTQGANEYSQNELVHLSSTGNHVCLNSLGIAFADLLGIQEAVSTAVREDVHPAAELYLDETLFHSLRLDMRGSRLSAERWPYKSRMKSTDAYYLALDMRDLSNGRKTTQ